MRIQYLATVLALSGQSSDAFITHHLSRVGATTDITRLHESKAFVNDGPFSFMEPFLGVFQEGKTTYYGPPVPVKEEDKPPEEEQIARRKAAEENMTNIGMEERDRRGKAGKIFQKVTIAYAMYSSLILDGGDFGGHLARFAIILPLFFAFGYTKSAESGLWNIAQAGLWDVDGTGVRKIEDQSLARAFLDKVNQMNTDTGIEALALATAFAALPQELTYKLAASTLFFGGLYLLKGKIPTGSE